MDVPEQLVHSASVSNGFSLTSSLLSERMSTPTTTLVNSNPAPYTVSGGAKEDAIVMLRMELANAIGTMKVTASKVAALEDEIAFTRRTVAQKIEEADVMKRQLDLLTSAVHELSINDGTDRTYLLCAETQCLPTQSGSHEGGFEKQDMEIQSQHDVSSDKSSAIDHREQDTMSSEEGNVSLIPCSKPVPVPATDVGPLRNDVLDMDHTDHGREEDGLPTKDNTVNNDVEGKCNFHSLPACKNTY